MESLASSRNAGSASRREFLGGALCAGAFFAAGTGSATGADAPSNRVRLAIAGVREKCRGIWLVKAATVLPGVEVAVVCDVDSRAMDFAAEEVFRRTGKRPRKEKDLRKILEDPEIDGLVAAIPDHWHAASAWMAMEAGKAIYVEKPCSFCGAEGQVLLRVQKRTGMVFQMGSQRRSSKCYRDAIERMRELIGEPKFARCWYTNNRKGIGRGKAVPVPEWLDWDLWQGPAPRRPFRDNVTPYGWHWHRHWGTGEMGNNSPHYLDVARWALGVGNATRTVSGGGRLFRGDDDWAWPDSQNSTFEFEGGKYITYDCLSAVKWRPIEGIGTGCLVFGEGGAIFFHPASRVFHYDTAGKKVAEWSDPFASDWIQSTTGASEMDLLHLGNFVDAIRAKDPSKCVAPAYEGVASSVMAHTANMAYFTGETVRLDGKTGELLTKTPEAAALWNREYEKGWEPPKA